MATLLLWIGGAQAQNTGGVFGPVVDEGHRAVQYRVTYDPNSENIAQRIHFEQALNDAVMARIVGQVRRPGGETTEFDYVQGELFWQVTPNEARWQHGFRFDGRVRGSDRPGFLAASWMNQIDLFPRLELRSLVLSTLELGENRRQGVFLETRAHLAYRAAPWLRLGIETFNPYGSTNDLSRWDRQNHQYGPFATIDIGDGWSLFAGALFGASDEATDREGRFWLTKVF